ncbi:MAG TPA: cytochrome C oxidase subunit IV family protein [Tepidisphaeraceae bacterium]|jgi:cytochrome c oxidase subunit 4|nr:cytochrome C oxidase subunit IV family protein [Tepidisphaeraceae bacterium]
MSYANPPASAHRIDDGAHVEGAVHVHAVSPRLLLTVFGCLLVLTVVTVAITKVPLGAFAIWAALGIAVIKATLVLLYFMHLRWDTPFNAIIFVSALLFVAIFISATIGDSNEYKVNYLPPPGSEIQAPQ